MRSAQIFDELPKIHFPTRNQFSPHAAHQIVMKRYPIINFGIMHAMILSRPPRILAFHPRYRVCIGPSERIGKAMPSIQSSIGCRHPARTPGDPAETPPRWRPAVAGRPWPGAGNREFAAADRNGRRTALVGRRTSGKKHWREPSGGGSEKSVCGGHQVRGTRRFESVISRLAPVCVSRRSLSGFPFAGGPFQEKSACCGS